MHFGYSFPHTLWNFITHAMSDLANRQPEDDPRAYPGLGHKLAEYNALIRELYTSSER